MEVQKCLLQCFSTNLQRKIDLTNGFKSFFRDNSFKLCSKIDEFLGVLGGAHACARARASEKLDALGNTLGALGGRAMATRFGTGRVPYHEALVRASGKDLAQG